MVIALAGRRIDAPESEKARFPLAVKDRVRQRIYELLSRQQATILICSAACGADLLALDAAGELGIRRRVVLPFAPDRFRKTSVIDRPGEWGPLFDRVIEAVDAEDDLIVLKAGADNNQAYAAANLAILGQAASLAQESSFSASGEVYAKRKLAVAVWDKAPRGSGDLTAAFLQEARRCGFEIAEVMTQ